MNISLEELKEKYDLSNKAFNLCKRKGLITQSSLLEYFELHRNFTDDYGYGDKTNKELTGVCKAIQCQLQADEGASGKRPGEPEWDAYLDDLDPRILSAKTLGVCMRHRIFSISDVLEYYLNNEDFRLLTGCGEQMELELRSLCESRINDFDISRNIEKKTIEERPEKPKITSLDLYMKLDGGKKSIVGHYFKYRHAALSNRSKNCLIRMVKESGGKKNVLHMFWRPYFDSPSVGNGGSNVLRELNLMKTKLDAFIKFLSKEKEEL